MKILAKLMFEFLRLIFRSKHDIVLENLALRRECLDHMIILNEKHLHSVLDEYINDYYNVIAIVKPDSFFSIAVRAVSVQ